MAYGNLHPWEGPMTQESKEAVRPTPETNVSTPPWEVRCERHDELYQELWEEEWECESCFVGAMTLGNEE